MQEDKDLMNNDKDEKEIDILELATKLWAQRRKVAKWCACGALVGLIVAFSIPREYDTTVKLAPELTDKKTGSGNLAQLASMAGLSIGSSGGADAVYPQLYPDVLGSVPFVTSLFDVPVKMEDSGKEITVKEYMEDEISSPWWSAVFGIPGKLIGLLGSGDESENHAVDNFRLTKDEASIVRALKARMTADVDPKTSVVTINVRMQDPLVCALLADTVLARLQNYVTDYRTNKARKDLEYAESLNQEAKEEYYKAQQRFADYFDSNQGIALRSAQIARDRLENEAQLAFNLYNQTAQQVQMAKAKVQENTPVYAVIVPATVPVKASSPRKPALLIVFTFFAFAACAGWLLFLEPKLQEYKAKAEDKGN